MRAVGVVALVAATFAARSAEARESRQLAEGEPATSRVLQVGLGGEYGVKVAGPALNPWGFGLGVSIGYTLPVGLYLGLPFDYFFGTKDTSGLPLEEKLWHVGLEGGYDLGVSNEVVFRLKGGVGIAAESYSRCEGDLCGSSTDMVPAFGPGLTFLYLGPHFSVTVDARYQLVLIDPVAQGLLFSFGFGF